MVSGKPTVKGRSGTNTTTKSIRVIRGDSEKVCQYVPGEKVRFLPTALIP
jgi:hypothetical protein